MTGKDLWKLRKKAGLTRQELAELSQISSATINDFEHGRRDIRIRSLDALLNTLGYELVIQKSVTNAQKNNAKNVTNAQKGFNDD